MKRKWCKLVAEMGALKLPYYDAETENKYPLMKVVHTTNEPLEGCLNSYLFGMQMPGRNHNSSDYKYGFNGKTKDDELKTNGNSYDFGARLYDPRLGRFLTIDAKFYKAPEITPYRFGFNSPIVYNDPDGNYEADGSLSKSEKKQIRLEHKSSGEKDWRKNAKAEIADKVKQNIETINAIVKGSKEILDINPQALEAFKALTGIQDEKSKEFKDFFVNNGSGPKITLRDIASSAETDNRGITLSSNGHTFLSSKLTILHEYIHYSSFKGFIEGDNLSSGYTNLLFGGRTIDVQEQAQALVFAKAFYNEQSQEGLSKVYSQNIQDGLVEGGFLFDKLAFGMVILQPYKAANLKQNDAFNEKFGMQKMEPKPISFIKP